MAIASILVVEDENAVREMLVFVLKKEGFSTLEAGDAEQASSLLRETVPSLILLDWMLPGQSGVEFARALKRDAVTKHIPIIMLTARGEEDDKVRGLESGADDYITKPFSNRELVARIKVVLRRVVPHASEETVLVNELSLDPVSRRVVACGEAVDLGPTEFRLLHFFMTHPERVFSRTQLLDRVWGTNVYVEERTVDVHIRRLRKALQFGACDRMIQTVRGAGYRFSGHA